MNNKTETPRAKPKIHSLTLKQLLFVGALLLLGFVLSILIVRFVDPSRAVTNHASIQGIHDIGERAPALG